MLCVSDCLCSIRLGVSDWVWEGRRRQSGPAPLPPRIFTPLPAAAELAACPARNHLQFTNSGGISAAALPTPFDQPGGMLAVPHAAAFGAAAAAAAGQQARAHPMALHEQQAMALHEQQAAAAAAYMAALQAQAAQAAAAQDQYTAAVAAAAAEHAYLVCPPPVQQAPLHIMVGKVRC